MDDQIPHLCLSDLTTANQIVKEIQLYLVVSWRTNGDVSIAQCIALCGLGAIMSFESVLLVLSA